MKKLLFPRSLFALNICLLLLLSSPCWAAVREEFEEKKTTQIDTEAFQSEIKSLEKEVIEKKEALKKYKFLSNLEVATTYDTNARQAAIRKGDHSQNVRYAFHYNRTLADRLYMTFNYNFDGSSYWEYNELTNFLNHMRLAIDKSFNPYWSVGAGYDFSSFYYPDSNTDDFYFHKFFTSLKHQFNKKIYHQLIIEEGFKDYVHQRAYADSTASFQADDRRDVRHGAEYNIGVSMLQKLYFRLRTKFSINDSNALYQDYYDYTSLDLSPSLSYKISESYLLNLSMTVIQRDYENRKVTSGSEVRKDTIYTSNVGLRYNLDKHNVLSLGYGYSQNNSNDHQEEYSGSSINCGWQHQF